MKQITDTIPAEQITVGDTIFIGGFSDQAMRVFSVTEVGKTRIHVVIDSGMTFSYRRRERVAVRTAS